MCQCFLGYVNKRNIFTSLKHYSQVSGLLFRGLSRLEVNKEKEKAAFFGGGGKEFSWREDSIAYAGRMTETEALDIFRQTGALLEGHFILRSGLRSRQFFQCALALQMMPNVERLGAALAEKARGMGAATVISPAMGGLVIGQEVARQLGIRFIFAEKEDGKLVLRRGFKIAAGEKILIVEDVVTKGGRVQETIDIVRAHGGNVLGVGMVVDRSNGTVNLGVPMFSVLKLQVETFDADKLPPDLAAMPPVKPGSK